MSKIVVKNNAPNWPAMVKTAPKAGGIRPEIDAKKLAMIRNMKNSCAPTNVPPPIQQSSTDSTTVATGLWLKKRYNSSEVTQTHEPKRTPIFAPKIVRQCNCCQMLYTNYHMCPSEENSSTFSRKEFVNQQDLS